MKKLLLALTLVLCLAASMVALTSCGGGADDGDECEHTWASVATVDEAATCTTDGAKSIKCTACGEKKADSTTVIPAIGHAYDEGTITTEATCASDGYVTKTCANCGGVNNETIPATGNHIWQANASVDSLPTCTTDGQKSIKCIMCQSVKDGSVEVLPASHDWQSEPTIDAEPTADSRGQKSIKCFNCGEIKPGSVVVLPALNETSYSYPMDTIVIADGTIDHSKTTDNAQHKYKTDMVEKVVFIDLSELPYNTVTLTPNLNGEVGFVTFLSMLPYGNEETVNYAFNYNDMLEINAEITLCIPDNAKYLVVVNNDNYGTECLPSSIVFTNTATPSANLRDDSLASYEYPMDTLSPSQGTIKTGGTFVSNYWWNSIIIDLDGIVFDKILLEIGDVGSVWWAFLTEYPIVDSDVSYVGDATGWSSAEGNPGDVATVDIPDNAKCIVIVWMEKEGNDFVYYAPTGITFVKDEDAE